MLIPTFQIGDCGLICTRQSAIVNPKSEIARLALNLHSPKKQGLY